MNTPDQSSANQTSAAPHRHERRDERPDLTSTHVDEDIAMAGRCGNIHVPSGRICTLPERHRGSCHFVTPPEARDAVAHQAD